MVSNVRVRFVRDAVHAGRIVEWQFCNVVTTKFTELKLVRMILAHALLAHRAGCIESVINMCVSEFLQGLNFDLSIALDLEWMNHVWCPFVLSENLILRRSMLFS